MYYLFNGVLKATFKFINDVGKISISSINLNKNHIFTDLLLQKDNSVNIVLSCANLWN